MPRAAKNRTRGALHNPPDQPQLFYGSGEGSLTRRGAPEGKFRIFLEVQAGRGPRNGFLAAGRGLAGKIIRAFSTLLAEVPDPT